MRQTRPFETKARMHTTVDGAVLEAIKAQAKKEDRSISNIVNRILREAMTKGKKQ